MAYGGDPLRKLLDQERNGGGHKIGERFENDFIDGLHKGMYKPESLRSTVGTNLDTMKGTDAIYDTDEFKIPLDFTANGKQKDNLVAAGKTKIDLGKHGTQPFLLTVGIRVANTHNTRTEFDKPVIVLSINANPTQYKDNYDIIAQNIENNADNILMAAEDAYRDISTTSAEERKETLHVMHVTKEGKNVHAGKHAKMLRMLEQMDKSNDNLQIEEDDQIWQKQK